MLNDADSCQLQSVRTQTSSDESMIAAVNSKGNVSLIRRKFESGNTTHFEAFSFKNDRKAEGGWAGIEFWQRSVVVAKMFAKQLSILDISTGKWTANFFTSSIPTRLIRSNLFSSELVAIAEYKHVSVWDFRSNQPCIKTFMVNQKMEDLICKVLI